MARASKAQSEETARKIIQEATQLFADRGYPAVGLEEIAAAAAVTRGAIYHHFSNKRGVFEAVAAQAQSRVADEVVRAADAQTEPWDGLVAGCHAFLAASLSAQAQQILLIDAPAVLGWSTWRQQDAAASAQHLAEALAELAELGLVRLASVAGAAALLSGAMNEAALFVAEADDQGDALMAVTTDLDTMLSGLR